MIIEDILKIQNINYKVVLIGSGPAGLSIALEFEKKKIPCLLIEAGDEQFTENAINRYKSQINGNFPNKLGAAARLSQFGGSSGHWGGACIPLDEYDFDDWPIKKNNLSNYIQESCNILDIKNQFRNKLINDDLKIIEFQQSKVSFYEKYFEKIKKSKYIYVLLKSPIFEISLKDNSVQNIKIIKNNTVTSIKINNYIVLCCGGIENSRLLLWFSEKNNNFLKNMPVGEFWMEHPFKVIGKGFGDFKKIKKIFKNDFNMFDNFRNWGNFTVSLAPTKNLIKKKNILNSGTFLTLHDRNNNSLKNNIKDFLCFAPKLSNKILGQFNKNLLCGITLSSSWEQDPERANKISLGEEKDYSGIPNTILNYQISEKTLRTPREIIRSIGKFFVEKKIGYIGGDKIIYDIDNFISDAGYHHIGGTRMGTSKLDSVVDSNLKVHGTKNLYVCGSSVFTKGGHANPTLTIVQLSLRLANYLYTKII